MALFLHTVSDYMCFIMLFHRLDKGPLCGPNMSVISSCILIKGEVKCKYNWFKLPSIFFYRPSQDGSSVAVLLCSCVQVLYVTFVLSQFVPHLAFSLYLEKIVLHDCGIPGYLNLHFVKVFYLSHSNIESGSWHIQEKRIHFQGRQVCPKRSKFFSFRVDIFSEDVWCTEKKKKKKKKKKKNRKKLHPTPPPPPP